MLILEHVVSLLREPLLSSPIFYECVPYLTIQLETGWMMPSMFRTSGIVR